ncbi:hypothetical protein DFP73DRAFT_599481 [Morchella snyderi]|nr:hypothetical protein DFP73DRAFT_599481 [Morchella snyderi]
MNPFTSLLSALALEDEMTHEQMLKRELICTTDWASNIPGVEAKLKAQSPIPRASRDHKWHARISRLMQSAAARTNIMASMDPFTALAIEIGFTMKVIDLQRVFRSVWDTNCMNWLDIPTKRREEVEYLVMKNMLLPKEASELAECKTRLRGRINEAGNRSWFNMRATERHRIRKRRNNILRRNDSRKTRRKRAYAVERDKATNYNPGAVSDNEGPAEQLRREEKMERLRRERGIEFRGETKAGISRWDAAETGLPSGETNYVETIENGRVVLVILSDDEH